MHNALWYPGAYLEILKEGRNLKPKTVEAFLVGLAFLLVSAYVELRLSTYAFRYISPFNTLIFVIFVYLGHWFSTGGPQTFAYFNNGFASRMRLRNTGAYEQPYGPAPINWRRIDLIFLCKSAPIPPAEGPSSALGRQ